MFTGIIEEVGHVRAIEVTGQKRRVIIAFTNLLPELKLGDSISVSGVCLTAVNITEKSFSADLAQETWLRTSLSRLEPGALVNLELPMRAQGRFGGHIVQGHVDGTGKFVALDRIRGAQDYWLRIEIPPELARYVIFKGSLSVEGISLTIAKVEGTKVTAAIIPHTIRMTNLKSLKADDPVNLEVDIVAKYVEKMIGGESTSSSITVEKLLAAGF